jgi:suppressor of G2 allele of SKP1
MRQFRTKASEPIPVREPAKVEASAPAQPKPTPASTQKGPAYPTSSKSGPKDWDRITGDEDDGDEAQQGDVNYFFKKLYAGADPDAQRAMMKSFTESNGTSLSTNWADVKDRTVETKPPEGIEAKKW